MNISWIKYPLNFKFEAGTSRGVLTSKTSYLIFVRNEAGSTGIGECSLLPGLSMDDRPDIDVQLENLCTNLSQLQINDMDKLLSFLDEQIGNSWPSLRMGFETAFLDLIQGGKRVIFQNGFLNGDGIPINGLIWMGDRKFMLGQLKQKIDAGYSCIKMKIGALDFNTELDLLRYVRERFPASDLTLRVDANGAFSAHDVMDKLVQLEKLKIHSIEQPIKPGQWEQMYDLCRKTPVPIGLDEELIGENDIARKKNLIESIKPQYLILKPSLLGGFKASNEWIEIAEPLGVGWWITSALESNIGLNAICQYTYGLGVSGEQGLGTGQLFSNNIGSPLEVLHGYIRYNGNKTWELSDLGIEGIQ